MIEVKDILSLEQAEYAIKKKGGFYKVFWSQGLDGYVTFFSCPSAQIIGGWNPSTYILYIY